jgi:Recombination endonuclease VII
MIKKTCPRCKITTELFQKNRASKDGLQYHCNACRKEIDNRPEKKLKDRERYHTYKDVYNDVMYKRKYGISLDTYNDMLKTQGGVCEICEQSCKSGRRLAVDHCHTTNKVRGLLCSACNQGLGLFKDSPELMLKAIQYLKDRYGKI